MYRIEFYEDKNGKSDVADFIRDLNAKAATNKECRINFNKIIAYMDILEEMGTFVKKTQKTPKREIEQAKRKLKDYLERNE